MPNPDPNAAALLLLLITTLLVTGGLLVIILLIRTWKRFDQRNRTGPGAGGREVTGAGRDVPPDPWAVSAQRLTVSSDDESTDADDQEDRDDDEQNDDGAGGAGDRWG